MEPPSDKDSRLRRMLPCEIKKHEAYIKAQYDVIKKHKEIIQRAEQNALRIATKICEKKEQLYHLQKAHDAWILHLKEGPSLTEQ